MLDLSSPIRDWTHFLHWKCDVLTTGLPEKSADFSDRALRSNSDLSWLTKQYVPCCCPQIGLMTSCQGWYWSELFMGCKGPSACKQPTWTFNRWNQNCSGSREQVKGSPSQRCCLPLLLEALEGAAQSTVCKSGWLTNLCGCFCGIRHSWTPWEGLGAWWTWYLKGVFLMVMGSSHGGETAVDSLDENSGWNGEETFLWKRMLSMKIGVDPGAALGFQASWRDVRTEGGGRLA